MKKVLILNKDYQPLQIIDWKKAMVKLFSETSPVDVVKFYDDFKIRTVNDEYEVPAVLVIRNRYVKYKRKASKQTGFRKYVYVRDNFTCQYCEENFFESELTVDHVQPKSRGGSNEWENLVTCCKKCNIKKGNRLPKEIKMFPKNNPRPLKDIDLMRYYFMSHKIEPEWEDYVSHIL